MKAPKLSDIGFAASQRRRPEVLFAGPWLGEFGWELLNWQGFLRWLAPTYRRVIVACRPGAEALYADFADEFVPHHVAGVSIANTMTRVDNPDELARVRALAPPGADRIRSIGWQPMHHKRFIRFGTKRSELGVDVLFHARGRSHSAGRNWSGDKWSSAVDALARQGLKLGAIGLTRETVGVDGTYHDFRDAPLAHTMDLMASARLVIGPSSGPIHLASLCHTPHMVWTDAKPDGLGLTNRRRYETWWNPMATPVLVVDHEGFDPQVSTVVDATTRALASLA